MRRFDLAEVLVLVPGRKLVRSLEHRLLERSRSVGAPLVSPTFVTPARLATLVVDPFGVARCSDDPSASEPRASHAVGALLSETAERLVWRRVLESVFAEDPAAIEAVFGLGLAARVAPDSRVSVSASVSASVWASASASAAMSAPPVLEPRVVPVLVERLLRLSREAYGACSDFAAIARGIAAIADGDRMNSVNGRDRGKAAPSDEAARAMAVRLADSWRTLARLESRFATEASRDGTVRTSREAAIVRALSVGSVVTAGFRRVVVLLADPEPLHRAVLRALEASGVAVEVCVHRPFKSGGAEVDTAEVDEEGFPVVERWIRRPFPESVLSADSILCAGTPEEQAARAVHAIERIAFPRRSDRIAFVSGDGPTRLRLECELHERGVVLASGSERPFVETRIGQLLVRLEQLLDARAGGAPSLGAFAAFVRHPDVAARLEAEGIADGPDEVSRFRATCASESIDDRVPMALSGGREHAGYERLRRWTVELLDRAIRDGVEWTDRRATGDGRESIGANPVSSGSRRPAQAWATAIRALLERIVGSGAADDAERVVDERHRAIRALDEALAELASVPDACAVEMTIAEAIAIVLARLGSSVVRDHAGTDGVPILGWLDAGIADEPDLVVVGMNEGVVPESAGGDALLPEPLREALGLPSSKRRVARDAWILDGMLARRAEGRGSIAFIVGRQDAAGDPLRPSRFVLSPGDGGDALARRVLLLTGESAPGAVGARGTETVRRQGDVIGRPCTSKAPLAFPITPAIAEPRIESVSVTGFARYLKCPYLFLLERDPRLRLGSDDEDAFELDPLAFGNLVHGALETWGRMEAERPTPTTDAGRIRGELVDALDHHVRRHFGRRLAPAVEVQIELARRRLERFAEIQAREAEAGWKVAFVELAFQAPKGVRAHDATESRLASGAEARAILQVGMDGATDRESDGLGDEAAGGAPPAIVHPALRLGRSTDGRQLFVTGRIDRVDRHADGRYRALDYKTSASGAGPTAAHLGGRGSLDKREWKDLQLPLYRRLLASIGVDVGSQLGYIVLAPKLAQCRVAMLEVSGKPVNQAKFGEADALADEIADAILAGEFTPAGGPRGGSCPVRADDPMAAIWGKGYRGIDARIDGDGDGDATLDDSVDEGGNGSAEVEPPSGAGTGGQGEVAS